MCIFMILQAKSVRQEKEELLLHNVTILEMGRNASLNKSLEAYGATLKDNEFSLADVKVYEANHSDAWDDAYNRYLSICKEV